MSARKEVALVVGASRGIGRQVAIDLAKNGYKGTLRNAVLKLGEF
jgi:NAD(P)-dependent dehydrogenase (short-subunit alcohol dehydrogenase family)